MLSDIAVKYFENLNPIAQKITHDIKVIKRGHEYLWSTLSVKEQEKLLDKNLIYPEVLSKYYSDTDVLPFDLKSARPRFGQKVIYDEHSGASWKDEHSAPFSWKTASQLDLCLFADSSLFSLLYPPFAKHKDHRNAFTGEDTTDWVHQDEIESTMPRPRLPTGDNKLLSKLLNNALCKIQSTVRFVTNIANSNSSASKSGECEALVMGSGAVIMPTQSGQRTPSRNITKPNAPPPPPPIKFEATAASLNMLDGTLSDRDLIEDDLENLELYEELLLERPLGEDHSIQSKVDEQVGSVPKSGFDFLDNW